MIVQLNREIVPAKGAQEHCVHYHTINARGSFSISQIIMYLTDRNQNHSSLYWKTNFYI